MAHREKMDKAILLEKAEKTLRDLEEQFDHSLEQEKFDAAYNGYNYFDGALYMMNRLGLIDWDMYRQRTDAMFERYMKTRFSEHWRPYHEK